MIPKISLNQPTFKYNHPLKKAFDKGLLPKGFKGIYEVELTLENRTLEHITPRSQGGGLGYNNVALADRLKNNLRGVDPIHKWVTKEMWIKYLSQFVYVKNIYIDGMIYIKALCKRFKIDVQEVIDMACKGKKKGK